MQRVADEVQAYCDKHGSFNEDVIARSVVRSQPKQASDVMLWVKFVKRWGGGAQPRFVREYTKYFQCGLVPTGRMISSSFFEACVKLTLPPGFQPVALINAALIVHAADPTVADGICKFLSGADISGISGKCLEAAKEGEQILRNSRKMVADMDVEPIIKCQALLALFKQVVYHVFDKEKGKRLTLVAAAQEFAKTVSGLADVPSGGAASSSAAPVEVDPPLGARPVGFAEHGDEEDTYLLSMQNQGFDIDTLVFCKDKAYHQNQFVIKEVKADGAVVLAKVALDGSTTAEHTEVPHEDFGKCYAKTERKYKLYAFENADPSGNPDFRELEIKCLLQAALVRLQSLHKLDRGQFDITHEPKVGVFAKNSIEELRLIPSTFAMSPEKADRDLQNAWVIEMEGHKRYVLARVALQKEFFAPFWWVRSVEDEAGANMKIEQVAMSIDPAHMKGKKRVSGYVAMFPTMVNTRTIMPGEELKLHRVIVKAKTKAKAQPMCSDSKVAKTIASR